MGKISNKLFKERVDILIMPRTGSALKFRVRVSTLALLLVVWAGVTLAGWLLFARGYDYHITKADNQLMRVKMKLIGDELERGRKYLELARTTEKQMRQMLGMPGGKFINLPKGWEEAKEKEDARARALFQKDFKDLDAKEFEEYIDALEDNVQEQLASYQEIAWYFANRRDSLNSTPSIRPSSAVRHAGWVPSYGQAILVDHGFGYSTLYAHTTAIRVKTGDVVKRGEKIATMGSSGRSTGTHLHYEVWKDGQAVDPKNYFK